MFERFASNAQESIDVDTLVRSRFDEIRGRRSLQQIANAIRDLGYDGLRRPTLDRVVNDGQPLRVGELLALAAGLGVSPLHLLGPSTPDVRVAVTPDVVLDPGSLLSWLRGNNPIAQDTDLREFFRTKPWRMQEEGRLQRLAIERRLEAAQQRAAKLDEQARGLEDQLTRAPDDERVAVARKLGRLDVQRALLARQIAHATGQDLVDRFDEVLEAGPPLPADAFYAEGAPDTANDVGAAPPDPEAIAALGALSADELAIRLPTSHAEADEINRLLAERGWQP